MDTQKIQKFKSMQKPAGNEISKLSFNFILTARPKNISNPMPNEDNVKIGLNFKPTSKPVAPKNSKTMVNKPNFSRLNRLNSFFICGDMKQDAT